MAIPIIPILVVGGLFKRIGRGNELPKEGKGTIDYPLEYPPVGSVVYRNMKMVEHSGVYVGGGLFAYKDKTGEVVARELGGFLGSSASNLFVSADNAGEPVGLLDIAGRAKSCVGKKDNHGTFDTCDDGSYDLVLNNCHIFTNYCITGKRNKDTGLSELKETAKRRASMTKWLKWHFSRDEEVRAIAAIEAAAERLEKVAGKSDIEAAAMALNDAMLDEASLAALSDLAGKTDLEASQAALAEAFDKPEHNQALLSDLAKAAQKLEHVAGRVQAEKAEATRHWSRLRRWRNGCSATSATLAVLAEAAGWMASEAETLANLAGASEALSVALDNV